MKIACLGGGGWYFTRPIADFALAPELHGSQIALYNVQYPATKIDDATTEVG